MRGLRDIHDQVRESSVLKEIPGYNIIGKCIQGCSVYYFKVESSTYLDLGWYQYKFVLGYVVKTGSNVAAASSRA